MRDKKGRTDNVITYILIAVVVFLVASSRTPAPSPPQSSGGAAGASGGAADTSVSNVVKVVGAPCTQGTTLTGSLVRRYTDVAQGSENVTIVQNGVLLATIAHGGTTTVQSGPNADLLDLFPAFDRSANFYSRHLRGKLETCTAGATTGDAAFKEVPRDEDLGDNVKLGAPIRYTGTEAYPNKVLQFDNNGNSNWFSIVNDGQANQNTGGQGQGTGANLTIGSGGSGSVTITFRPAYNRAIGPNGNVLACQYPQAVYSADAPLSVTYAGTALETTDTKPSTINYPLIGSNNTVKAFAFPGVDGRVTPTALMQITLRAASDRDPGGALDRLNCTIFDSDFYQRQRDGKRVLDIENRDNNNNLGLGGTGVESNSLPEPSFEIGVV